MRTALALAARGRGRVEPNPMVGAVIVDRGKVVGRGYHRRFGGPHAEVNAITDCGRSCRGATMYVTLEPCDKYGKTPPCTQALIEAGLQEVIYACADPLQKTGPQRLRRAGIVVRSGVLAVESRRLNAPFFKLCETGLPYVIAKWAMSIDGRATRARGSDHWISSRDSRRYVQRIRSWVDAIIVGVNTVIADDPLLTCRIRGKRNPARIVLDSKARLPTSSRLVKSVKSAPVIVAVTRAAPDKRIRKLERLGCEVLALASKESRVSLRPLLRRLGQRGMTNVLVEGGPTLLSSFFREKLLDKLIVFVAPVIIGAEGTRMPVDPFHAADMAEVSLEQTVIRRIGPDVMVEALVSTNSKRWSA